ncbi:hypothetical protein D5018_20920 [Parashewanella curva]|uniref:Uncharacterized protein n=1 Tax=Parashewanella curva TaxID=2338552 RepID=A0A3L8PQV3_9GAMM|nr:hypothetical protein [Parashewanella curva]RLV57750.1 hypothetical protein D5018_20920 [Parashewanella curva]
MIPYRLTPADQNRLKNFFNYQNTEQSTPCLPSHKRPPSTPYLDNLPDIHSYNRGRNNILDVVRITASNIKNCREMTEVWRLLDNIKSVKLKQGDSIAPSPFNVGLTRCLTIDPTHSRVTVFANATKVLAFIQKLRIKPDLITCLNFLSVCAECAEYDDAEALLFEKDDQSSLMQQWGLTPNITICNAYLTVCGKTGRFNKAVTFVGKQMPALGIKVNFVTYSLLAIVDINRFGGLIKKWIEEGVLLQHLGLHGTELNLHAKNIFNMCDSKGTELAVPFEFAKALFDYHRNEKKNDIQSIITGYHSGQKLRIKFSQLLKEELKVDVTIDPSNPGVIILSRS